MSQSFDLISALNRRGHLAQIVTYILTLIDDEAFLRTQLRLVSKSWRRVVVDDDLLWNRISAQFQKKDRVYAYLRQRLESRDPKPAPAADDDDDDNVYNDCRIRAFDLHLDTLRHKASLTTSWREWNWRRSSVDHDESLDLLLHDEVNDLIFVGDIAAKLICFDVADGNLSAIAEWKGRATRSLVGGWLMKSTLCWGGFLFCPTYGKEIVIVAVGVRSNDRRPGHGARKLVHLAVVYKMASWTGPELSRPLFDVGDAVVGGSTSGLMALARHERTATYESFKLETYLVIVNDGVEVVELGSSPVMRDVSHLQNPRINKDGTVCLVCRQNGSPHLLVFSSFGDLVARLAVSDTPDVQCLVAERTLLLIEHLPREERTNLSYYDWPLPHVVESDRECRPHRSYSIGGAVVQVFLHPFMHALIYYDQFRLNLRNLKTSEVSFCELNASSAIRIGCVHKFGVLAKIDDGSSSTIVHLSFV